MPYTHKYYVPFFENYGFRDYFKQYIYRTRLVEESLSKVVVWKSERLLKNGDYRISSYREMTPEQAKEAFLVIYNQAWNVNVHGVGAWIRNSRSVVQDIETRVGPRFALFRLL